ncbi:pyridoxamine 5'-phosphate oxidase family protein [Candidatus Dojkabacteria bacterium]|nr:pyridoxamine 5'-phosphate oxidase family protein [Candidatus Dojkabacteria bacterium]
MTPEEKAAKIIKDNLYMTISVASKKAEPWAANIYFACDKQYHFYWYSPIDSLHSSIIRDNPNIAISIFNSTAVGDEVDAVYIKAKALEVNDKMELIKGLTIYGKRMLSTGFATTKAQIGRFIEQYKDFQGISKLRLYKATPIKIWKLAPSVVLNDKFVDSRIEIKL